jgi:uncharacterized repeat protein (TIGR01451 family)
MSNIAVDDPTEGPVTCPETSLDPGDFETCTANNVYTITQGDVNSGVVNDTATVSGSSPGGGTTTPPPSSTTTPLAQTPAITLTKTATQTSYSAIGQTINYNYLATNTGNVLLSAISINDAHNGLVGLACPDATLAPAAFETCTATYLVTAADMSAGTIVNTATAQGDPPGTTTPVVSAPSTVTIPVASVGLVKLVCGATSATACGPGGQGPWVSSTTILSGSTAYWKITVTNTGKIALSGVTVTDALVPTCAAAAGTFSLAVGASQSFYCSSSNVTKGMTNVASAQFPGQGGTPVSSSAQVTIAPPAAVTPAALAFTGIESLDLKVYGGFAMILLGLGFVLLTRRGRRGKNVRLP